MRIAFWINTTFACAGVETDERGIVVEAAPIYRKSMMGRHLNDVVRSLRRNGRLIEWKRIS